MPETRRRVVAEAVGEGESMSFQMFHVMCPEVGLHETRSVTLPANSADGLPADDYAFLERHYTMFRAKIAGHEAP
jgi:hypothetical protein